MTLPPEGPGLTSHPPNSQKRYERMLKAHNVSGTSPPSPTESEATPKKSAGKKRGGGAAAATTEETPTKKRTHLPKSKPVKEETGDEDDKPIKKVEDEGSEYSPLSGM